MNRDTRIASKALFTLVTRSEPRLLPLKKWYYDTVETIERWYQSEGNQGVKRAKWCLQQAWLAILGEPLDKPKDPRWIKMREDWLPLLTVDLVERVRPLRKDRRLMSAVLSLVRMTDLWVGVPDEATIRSSLIVIDQSRLPITAKRIVKEFGEFVADLLSGAYDRCPLVQAIKQPLSTRKGEVYHFTRTSQGPNGALSEHAHLDLVTLRNSIVKHGSWGSLKKSNLYEEIKLLWKKMTPYMKSSWKADLTSLESFSDEQLLKGIRTSQNHDGKVTNTFPVASVPGKISLKFEKSGKVRLVASPDWYTQYALQPLGDWLFDVLRSWKPDCTFDQRSAIPRIVDWQNEGRTVYSYDQSSCTDLFPVIFQTEFLARRFDVSLAESVRTVLTDREWELTLPKTKTKLNLRWSVGQPLGIYASWPLMAVAHHLLVQFASWRATSLKSHWVPFEDYVICGDDIVIGSMRVAESYRRITELLGMKINKTKSHKSGGRTGVQPVSEFAKVTIWNGQLLYELKPNQLRAAIRDWRLAVPLLCELSSRDHWNMSFRGVKSVIEEFWPRHKRFLNFVLSIPPIFGGGGLRNDQPLLSKFVETIKVGSHIHPLLYFLCKRVRAQMLRESAEASEEDRTTPDWAALDEEAIRLHPDYDRLVTERESRKFKLKPSIPSLRELIVEVLTLGWRKIYFKYLLDEVKPGPSANFGEERDRVQRIKMNAWADALTRAPKLSLGVPVAPELPELSGDISEDLSLWLEAFATLQIDRIYDAANVMRAGSTGESAQRF